VFSTLDFAFGDYPMMASLIAPLSWGGKLVFFDGTYRINSKPIINILEKEKIETIVSSPPFFEIPSNENRSTRVKKVLLGGQRISPAVLTLLKKTFPKAHLVNAVGSQEASIYFVNISDKNSTALHTFKALPNLEYKLFHKELYLKDTWPGLALPLNNRRAYADRWRGRFFKTGDLIKKTSLGLEVTGRVDKVTKYRGRQINLEYLESVIESQPLVEKAKCITVQSSPRPQVVVFLRIKKDRKKISVRQIRTATMSTIDKTFGSYVNPGKIFFVDQFPTSSSGKVMEEVLLKKYGLRSK
jgi:acyl-coenzyme A synthetase/AMP-(fatty) acid ligase